MLYGGSATFSYCTRLRVAKRLVAGGGIECAGGRAGFLRPGERPEAAGATEAKPDGAGSGGRAANDGTATQSAVDELVHLFVPPSRR